MDNKSKNQGIPTFTPPEDVAPVFTPPKTPQHDGPVCYHHPSEPAQDAVNIYVRTVLKHTLLQVANTPTSACVSIAVNSSLLKTLLN